jgi:predicted negative regulator of RcsB-dependent stress response
MYEQALAAYDEAESKGYSVAYNIVARNGLACTFVESGELGQAMLVVEEISRRTSHDLISKHIRGMIHLRRGDLDIAIAIFRNGIEASSRPKDLAYFRSALATCHIRQGKLAEALAVLPVEMADLFPPIQTLRVQILGLKKQFSEARQTYDRLAAPQTHVSKELYSELKHR